MIYFIDFDGTIADTSITKECQGDYKEKQKLIPQFIIYDEAVEFIKEAISNGDAVYIVSGNVGSTIKKTIKHFHIPISEDNVVGYRQGMPMNNLQRKIAVIKEAIKKYNLQDRKEEIIYIGDEADDITASELTGITSTYPKWIK